MVNNYINDNRYCLLQVQVFKAPKQAHTQQSKTLIGNLVILNEKHCDMDNTGKQEKMRLRDFYTEWSIMVNDIVEES